VRHGGSLAVFLALAVVYLLPGPDMILLLQPVPARVARRWPRRWAWRSPELPRGIGGIGLAALFKAAPWTFDVVRLAGAAYLLWIGIQCLRTTCCRT
jgi:threonine/homoserine/homoserine lactone efflux protein